MSDSNLDGGGTNPPPREAIEDRAEDALDRAIAEAPGGSQRDRFRYAREHIFPLIEGLEDRGERGAALDDVARALKLRKPDLRGAFARFEEQSLREQASAEQAEGEGGFAPEPGNERHGRAMELLKSPDILGRAVRDTERLGHVGEATPKKLLLVCCVSARAGLPIQPSIHAESSAGKNHLADTVTSLLPPETVIRISAISAKALYRTGEDLKGKVLYLQEHAGSEDADFTFRVMQSDGRLVYEATEQAPDGGLGTVVHEKEGPLVILQTTTEQRLFGENDTRVFSIYLDESPEQTRRIVEHAMMVAETGGILAEEREAILAVWHDAIRLLEPAEVVVPFARRIELPFHRVRVRRDAPRLLDVIRVHAWLHQHRRGRDARGRVLATEEDFRAAVDLVADSLESAWKSLTPAEEAMLDAARKLPEANRKNGFTRGDLEVEGHDKRRVQEALKSLSETGHIERDRRGGPGGYRYTLPRDPEVKVLGISLRPPGDDSGDGPDGDGPGGPGAGAGDNHAGPGDTDERGDGGTVARARVCYEPAPRMPVA